MHGYGEGDKNVKIVKKEREGKKTVHVTDKAKYDHDRRRRRRRRCRRLLSISSRGRTRRAAESVRSIGEKDGKQRRRLKFKRPHFIFGLFFKGKIEFKRISTFFLRKCAGKPNIINH